MYNLRKLYIIWLKTGIAGLISIHPENFFVLNHYIIFKYTLKFSIWFSTHLQFWTEFSTCLKIFHTVFNMPWNFQNGFSTCFQHITYLKIWNICTHIVTEPIQKSVKSYLRTHNNSWIANLSSRTPIWSKVG